MQFKEALKDFNHALGQSLLPTLTRLIPQFAKLLPYVEHAAKLFARLVEDLAENPLKGLGKLILMKVAADLAMANIGKTVNMGIERAISAAMGLFRGGGKGAPGTTGGGGGMAGAAGLGLQLGLTAATVILTAGIVNFEKTEAEIAQQGQDLNFLRAAGPDQLQEARERFTGMRKRADDATKPGMVETMASELASILPAFLMSKPGIEGQREFGKSVAEFTGARRPEEIKSKESMVSQGRAELERIEKAAAALDKAAQKNDAAASKFSEAVGRMPTAGAPNRGNTPSTATGT